MEAERAFRCLRLEIRCRVANLQSHLPPPLNANAAVSAERVANSPRARITVSTRRADACPSSTFDPTPARRRKTPSCEEGGRPLLVAPLEPGRLSLAATFTKISCKPYEYQL